MHTAAASARRQLLRRELTENELDAYWTLVMYHNSLRELGQERDPRYATTSLLVFASSPATRRRCGARRRRRGRTYEQRARISTPPILSRMEDRFETGNAISVLASTNMLSVGVDVARLGIMFVIGQPKTTSEYIQATSRVGRSAVPGLVVTLLTATKPRDRSHYESFLPYHAALYRHVEPDKRDPVRTSVTRTGAPRGACDSDPSRNGA